MTRTLAILVLLGSALLPAADDVPKQKAVVMSTEHLDFPAGGTLRFSKSIGELDVEGWDEPGVEITTIKSSKVELNAKEREQTTEFLRSRIKITSARQGDELLIQSSYPKYSVVARPFAGMTSFDLQYRVKAPHGAKLVIDQDIGQVFVNDIRGDIHATDNMGDIELHLPQDAQYDIDSRAKVGAVNSDFSGHEQRQHFFGHEFVHSQGSAPHKLYLRMGVGDIVILKISTPAEPAPLAH